MAYKNLTVNKFQNKLNNVLPILDDRLHLLGINESPGYSNQLCTADSNNIAILQNLQNEDFSTLYYKTTQSSDSTRRLYDQYESPASITRSEQTVTYSVNDSNQYKNRAYISYTGDPNSGYATTYSQSIKNHTWATYDMGTGYCLGYYETGSSSGYSYTAEQQYKYLFTNFSINSFLWGTNTSSIQCLMYYTYFKSNIGNCSYSGSNSWQDINSYSESYPNESNDMSPGVSAFNWDSTALNNYNYAYYYRSWPDYHKNITGMKRSTLQKLTGYVEQSLIESQLTSRIYQSTGFVKYLYSPKDPGDVIRGRINSDNYHCTGLAVDGNQGYSYSFDVFSSFYGFNNYLNNYHYTPIWVYAAYDITKCHGADWYKKYLLMTQRNKYYSNYSIYNWSTLQSYGNNSISVYYNGAWRRGSFNTFFNTYVKSAPCMGYVVIPVALILVCYAFRPTGYLRSGFLSSNINNIQSTYSTYKYPKFSYETYDGFATSTNYKQSINTIVTKVVKCGSSSDTRYLIDHNRAIYWNQATSRYANACLAI